ncbi:MAG: ATP-binding protein [Chloroflexota bacterium]|nr:ATP-binding protein [Chloroflexota bacterium]
MSLQRLQLDQITLADLQALVEHEVCEGKEIDYKEQLPGSSDGEKREFLYDVASFANCNGGDILYGVPERRDDQNRPTGMPASLTGIAIPNLDSEKLRLESLIRDGIEPRIVGVAFQPIPVGGTQAILMIRIPRSWSSPHMVKYQSASRFYSRNSAGKYPLV